MGIKAKNRERSKRDVEWGFFYDVNKEGGEYLIALATIKDIKTDRILTKEWPHWQKRGSFFSDAKKGQRWRIVYEGNNAWTPIVSTERI
jgi:hypothetical protein